MLREEVQLVVGDDHEALRRGVVGVLELEEGLRVVGQARDGEELVALAERRRPDVVIADVGMPRCDGVEVCRELSARGVPAKVVLYTGSAEPALLQAGFDAGARAFVLKSGPASELVRAVHAVAAGGSYLDATLAASVIGRRVQAGSVLSPREAEVLQLLADGLTTDGVGEEIFLSPATVRSYAESAMRKLDAKNRVEAVANAMRAGLID